MKLKLTLFLLFFANSTIAKDIRVITGEHTNFTRVVLTLGEGSSWQTNQTGTTFTITVAGATSFDLSGIYELIPRNRVAVINTTNRSNELKIELGCDCRLEEFLYRDIYLVLDVIDQASDNASLSSRKNTQYRTQSIRPWWQQDITFENKEYAARDNGETNTNLLKLQIFNKLLEVTNQNPSSLILIESANTSQQKIRLTSTLKNEQSLNTPVTTHLAKDVEPMPPLLEVENCEARFLDKLFLDDGRQQEYMKITKLRTQIHPISKNTNNQKSIELALHYLKIGLISEALQLVDLTKNVDQDIQTLITISKLISDQSLSDSFDNVRLCNNSPILWKILTSDFLTLDDSHVGEVMIQFKALPPYIQKKISQRLIILFTATGYTSRANEIIEFVKNINIEYHSKINHINITNTSKTDRQLTTLFANENNTNLLLDLLGRARVLSSGQSKEIVELSKSVRHDIKGTASWEELLTLEVDVSLFNSDFQSALSRLDELKNHGRNSVLEKRLLENIVLEVAKKGSDSELLAIYTNKILESLSDQSSGMVINRLKRMNLGNLAIINDPKLMKSDGKGRLSLKKLYGTKYTHIIPSKTRIADVITTQLENSKKIKDEALFQIDRK